MKKKERELSVLKQGVQLGFVESIESLIDHLRELCEVRILRILGSDQGLNELRQLRHSGMRESHSNVLLSINLELSILH
jgi:hypothetical protein